MNEDKLFNIQSTQLREQIATIQWIAKNHEELIRALFSKVANENAEYFNAGKNTDEIFRGVDISQYCDNYVRKAIA